MTFPDKIADNISNKCHLLIQNVLATNFLVVFQQLTTVNSKRWKSDMQKELKVQIKYR